MSFLTGILTCCIFLLSHAQPVLKSSIDKNEILIGDQFKLTIEADFSPDDFKITWPVIPDSMAHFEVVNRSKLDSVYRSNRLSGLIQTFTLTSFDSGKWVLPSFLVTVNPLKIDTAYTFFTDSVPVTVSFSLSDTTSTLRDIKPIREAETYNPIWYYVGAAALLVLLIIFLFWFFKYYKKNKVNISAAVKISAYVAALKELEKLTGYDLKAPADIRIVHVQLGDILKRYLAATHKINFLNKTTGDVLIFLNDQKINKDVLAKTAAALRSGDALKFAKYLPPEPESRQCMQTIKEAINTIQLETAKPKL